MSDPRDTLDNNSKGMTEEPATRQKRLYASILERIFFTHFDQGETDFVFTRDEIIETAQRLNLARPKNLGDALYSSRYRAGLPPAVQATAPTGEQWIVLPAGIARYRMTTVHQTLATITPHQNLATINIPDSTPGLISLYALTDEQALLARLRYNRLIDIFTNLTCYTLQSHLRTTVPAMGQVETDELYVGVDHWGAHYVVPIQAKGGNDRLSVVQIVQDVALCKAKFPQLLCRPIAAQFMPNGAIALMMFVADSSKIGVALGVEQHYRLVPPQELTVEELHTYRTMAQQFTR